MFEIRRASIRNITRDDRECFKATNKVQSSLETSYESIHSRTWFRSNPTNQINKDEKCERDVKQYSNLNWRSEKRHQSRITRNPTSKEKEIERWRKSEVLILYFDHQLVKQQKLCRRRNSLIIWDGWRSCGIDRFDEEIKANKIFKLTDIFSCSPKQQRTLFSSINYSQSGFLSNLISSLVQFLAVFIN